MWFLFNICYCGPQSLVIFRFLRKPHSSCMPISCLNVIEVTIMFNPIDTCWIKGFNPGYSVVHMHTNFIDMYCEIEMFKILMDTRQQMHIIFRSSKLLWIIRTKNFLSWVISCSISNNFRYTYLSKRRYSASYRGYFSNNLRITHYYNIRQVFICSTPFPF